LVVCDAISGVQIIAVFAMIRTASKKVKRRVFDKKRFYSSVGLEIACATTSNFQGDIRIVHLKTTEVSTKDPFHASVTPARA
jgi:hypothetical protein